MKVYEIANITVISKTTRHEKFVQQLDVLLTYIRTSYRINNEWITEPMDSRGKIFGEVR